MESFDRTIAIFIPPTFQISLIELILVFPGESPEMSTSPHSHVDDTAGPDIDGAGIKFTASVLFGSDVRSTTTQTSGHVGFLFPGHAEAFAIAEIGDLEGTVCGEEEVLGFEISMGNAHLVHVFDAAHELLEVTVGFEDVEMASSQDEGVQIAAGTVLHHLAVVTFGILQQIEGVDDVGVAQGGRDAEFRGQALLILFGRLLGSFSKFLDGIEQFGPGVLRIGFVRDPDDAEGAAANNLLAFAVFLDQAGGRIGTSLFVAGQAVPFRLELIDPGRHQGELLVVISAVWLFLLAAAKHAAEHVGQFFLPLGRFQIMSVRTFVKELEPPMLDLDRRLNGSVVDLFLAAGEHGELAIFGILLIGDVLIDRGRRFGGGFDGANEVDFAIGTA